MNVPALAGGVIAAAITAGAVASIALLAYQRLDSPPVALVAVGAAVAVALGGYASWLAGVVAYSAVRRSQEEPGPDA